MYGAHPPIQRDLKRYHPVSSFHTGAAVFATETGLRCCSTDRCPCTCCILLAFYQKMIRPLETSRKKQTEFIASASHELRSPLAVIQSSVSAMDNAPGEETQHFISVIQKECSRMARLINDMLSLANADNHSWNLLTSPCELDTLLLETYEKYEPLANSKNLHLNIRLPEEPLPPCRCDASRVSQILAVLLDNALSYVPENGQITLSVRKENSFFFLTVTDNGPGIPDSAKEAVFQRFYRADASRHDKQHFGLGLCIAKEITLLHHGTISVTDTPGEALPLRSSFRNNGCISVSHGQAGGIYSPTS